MTDPHGPSKARAEYSFLRMCWPTSSTLESWENGCSGRLAEDRPPKTSSVSSRGHAADSLTSLVRTDLLRGVCASSSAAFSARLQWKGQSSRSISSRASSYLHSQTAGHSGSRKLKLMTDLRGNSLLRASESSRNLKCKTVFSTHAAKPADSRGDPGFGSAEPIVAAIEMRHELTILNAHHRLHV